MALRFAIDVETACDVEGCKHRGHSLCPEGHSLNPWQSKITVIGVVRNGWSYVLRGDEKVEQLKSLLALTPDYEVVGHNFKFDWLHIARHGFEIPLEKWVGDSQLAAYVDTEKIPEQWLATYEARKPPGVRKAGQHSLKTLAPYHLGVEPYWEAETDGDHDNDAYVLKDAEYTLRLVEKLEERLRTADQFEFYKYRQLEWAKLLLQAEWRGTTIDTEALVQMERELYTKSIELKEKLNEQWAKAHKAYHMHLREQVAKRYEMLAAKANKPINYGSRYWKLYEKARERLPVGVDYDSPKQMTWLLRNYLGYDITSLEGDESTGREVLERLAEEGHEDVRTYLEWRKVNKLLSAFIPTYKELTFDGVLHPIFNPDTTRTGRTSSARPNMQQVPPALRPLFKARPGFKLIGFDQAAIEAKLIALYTADPTLYHLVTSGISLHDFNTVNYFGLEGVDFSEVKTKYAKNRKAAKNVGFALFYNAGKNRIRIAFAQAGFPIAPMQATRIHERHKQAFPVATKFSLDVVRTMERGEVLVNLLGRPLKIQNPEDAYMQAFNTLIQSSASDLLLEGALRASKELGKQSIEAYPLLFVHDYVCFEVKEEQAQEGEQIINKCLTNFDLFNTIGQVALEVDGGVSDRWDK